MKPAMFGDFLGTKEGPDAVDPDTILPREPVNPDDPYEGHII